MSGQVNARFNLGCAEGVAGNDDLALQHWMIAAKMGHQNALNAVKGLFTRGYATKADYAAALRGYQSAVAEMRSPDRDEAKTVRRCTSGLRPGETHTCETVKKLVKLK